MLSEYQKVTLMFTPKTKLHQLLAIDQRMLSTMHFKNQDTYRQHLEDEVGLIKQLLDA